MSNLTIVKVTQHLESFPEDLQAQVLAFVEALDAKARRPRGVKGESLLPFVGALSQEDARQMREVIEAGCEQVDVNEW
jgi:hypothetical protein